MDTAEMHLYAPQQLIIKFDVCNPFHIIIKINLRDLIGQLAVGYCASKPMKNRASSEL